MSTQSAITFIGVGLMGQPMIRNLLQAGYDLTLWNRTPSKCEPFAGEARIAASAAEAVTQADIVISMLENPAANQAVLEEQGVIANLKAGSILIDMSSSSPELARKHADLCAQRQAGYVDAPVSGGTVGAAQASLSIMAGGEPEMLERVRPVLEVFGKMTSIGPVGTGQLAKLANQLIVGVTIGAVAEALTLAGHGGADPAAVREALLGGFANSRILDLHGLRMLERNFTPGGPCRIQLKDMRMIQSEASALGLSLPLTQQTLQQYHSLVAAGHAEADHSALLLELERVNGSAWSDRSALGSAARSSEG